MTMQMVMPTAAMPFNEPTGWPAQGQWYYECMLVTPEATTYVLVLDWV